MFDDCLFVLLFFILKSGFFFICVFLEFVVTFYCTISMQHKMNASLSVHLVYACICMLVGYC